VYCAHNNFCVTAFIFGHYVTAVCEHARGLAIAGGRGDRGSVQGVEKEL
jgi:hypothetical protein